MNTAIWEKPDTLAGRFWRDGHADDCPVYDMHGHMGTHNAIYFKRCEAPEMVAHLRRIGVKRLVFSHHAALWGAMRNAEVAEICRRFPDILRMYVAINPHYPDHIREDLAQFDRWTPYAIGLKFLPDYHQTAANDPAYKYAMAFAAERGLPILAHTWGGSACDGGAVMLEVAQHYPQAKFFLGHSIFGEWSFAERCVKETSGNVWLELTAIPGERGVIEDLVKRVGSERLLFGTDMPWFDEYQAVGGVLSADITEDDIRNILYRNAQQILGKDF